MPCHRRHRLLHGVAGAEALACSTQAQAASASALGTCSPPWP
jgi:hypothetical protein